MKLLFPTTMGAGIFLVIAPAAADRDAAAASQLEEEEPWDERDPKESLRLAKSK